jgi:drug/metabolite transporter superfamily protein YnfA
MMRVRQVKGACLAIAALLIVLLCVPLETQAASGRTYRVHGQVVAVNVSQSAQMIVVKTPLSKHNDMTVGAKVSAQTKITRKGKRISLQHVSVGEGVWLTYVKQRDGVFARIIQVQ